MLASDCLLALLGLNAVVTLTVMAGAESGPGGPPKAKGIKRREQELGQLCKRIGNFKKISQMEELIGSLRRVLEEKTFDGFKTQLGSDGGSFKLFKDSSMVPCLQQANLITELADIIGEKENVCTSDHIGKMEQYYAAHLRPMSADARALHRSSLLNIVPSSGPRPITQKFFELYANQVSFTCKSQLLHSLRVVEAEQLVGEQDYTKALPWLTYANSDTCKKIEQQERLMAGLQEEQQQVFATDPHDFTEQEIQQCKAGRTLTEITTIHELTEAFESDIQSAEQAAEVHEEELEATEKLAKLGSAKAAEGGESAGGKSALFLIVPPDQIDVVQDMLLGCSKLQPIYQETVQPIVRLAKIGYNVPFPNFDKVCSEDKLIQKWFGITLVCSSVLSSHLTNPHVDRYKDLREEVEASKKSVVVVDEDLSGDGIQQPQSPDTNPVASLFKNPIEDELWVYKYGTTKLQRFKDGILKKVFKLFKVEDIDDHIVFRKHVTGTNRWVIKIVILAVSLLILNK